MTTPPPPLEARTTLGAGALTTRFDDALRFAFERHRFHFRKGSRVPYFSHLMSVCALVLEHGGSEDQAIAALLHDAVEDAIPGQGPEVLRAIGEQFGAEVRAMVEACSDSLNDEHGKRPWRERKLRYVAGLTQPGAKSDDALLVTAADKVHNARSIARDLRTYGPGFWGTFSACEHDLLWYYTAVEAAIARRLGTHEIVDALHRAVDELVAASGTERADVPDQPSEGGCPRHASAG
ncbi:HD domain-containing protein [Geodermatophilus sp. SYSU D00815]